MAQSQQPERGGEAEFVRHIVTDPKNVPDVMRLYGYPGASSEEHHERLYLNPELSSWVEVPQSAILHRMEVPREQDPNGAAVLWVRREAALIQKGAPAAQALAQYFAGAIAGTVLRGGYPWPSPWGTQYITPYLATPYAAGPVAGAAAAIPAAAMALLPTGAHHPPWCPPPTLLCTKVGCPGTYVLSACCHPSYAPCTAECRFAAAAPAAEPFYTGVLCPSGPLHCHTVVDCKWSVPAVCHGTHPPICPALSPKVNCTLGCFAQTPGACTIELTPCPACPGFGRPEIAAPAAAFSYTRYVGCTIGCNTVAITCNVRLCHPRPV